MSDIKFTADDTDVIRALERIEGKLTETGRKAQNVFDGVFDTKEAQEAIQVLNRLEDEYAQLSKSANTLKQAMRNATDPDLIKAYADNIAKLEKGMKVLEQTGKSVGVNLQQANQQASTGRQVMENYFGAFTKVTLVLAAIDAVVKFAKYSVDLSEQLSKAKKSFEGFTGSAEQANKIVNTLIATGQKNFIPTDDILKAGKALLAFGEGADNLEAVLTRIADVSAATGKDFNELVTIYGKARTAGVLYAEDINQLVDAGIPIIQEFANQMGVSADQVKKLASEGKISFEELQLAIFNLTAEGGKFADQAQNNASTISGAWTKLLSDIQPVTERIGEFFSDIAKGFIFIAQDVVSGVKGIFSSGVDEIKDLAQAEKEEMYANRREYEKDLNERDRLEKEAAEARRKRSKANADEAAKLERERNKLRIDAMQDGEEKEIALENFRFNELKKALRKYHLDTSEAELQHQKNLLGITTKYAVERFEAEQELLELRKAQGEFEAKMAKDKTERAKIIATTTRDLALSEVEITEQEFDNLIKTLEAGGAKKEALEIQRDLFETQIKQKRIQAEIAYQQALLPLIDKGDKDQQQLVINRIEALKKALEGLEIPEPANGGGQPRNIWDLLGIEDPGDQQALGKAVSQVIDSLDQLSQARIRDAEAARRAADEKVKAAEDALKAEQDAAEKGFANNVDLKQRELDEAKKQRDAALKEEARARKQQILLDGALQVSGLITSSVNIFRSLSSLGPLGIALAVGTIGLMFGAFAKAKADALKAASAPKLRKGRKFDGPTHEQGNEDLVHDGRGVFAVEKDEWLIGTDHSKEHDKFLANLNQGRYRGVDLYSLGERARSDYSRSPLREATPRIQALITERADLEERNKYQALAAAYDRGVDKITAEIRRKPVTAPWKQGYKIIKDTGHGTETTTVQPTE